MNALDPVPAATPVPERMTVCGEFEALPLTVKVAVSAAEAVGEKVTVILQVAPTTKLAGQALESLVKSLFPERAMLLMVSTVVEEELVNVTVLLAVVFTV